MEIENITFKDMKLSKEIKNALSLLGYINPTEVQEEVIPKALCGKNIVAKSRTGTGKTAAFAIPVCEQTKWMNNNPSALVLEPTRELADQVGREIFNIGRFKKLKVVELFGGMPIDKQILKLKQKTHVVVGTPGRIMDHLRRDTLDLSNVNLLVIDEADLMLDMGFEDEVSDIMQKLENNENVQIMLFSATMSESVKRLMEQKYFAALSGPDTCSISIESESETVENVEQELFYVEDINDKYKIFKRVIIHSNPSKCMVFCGTREMVNVLYHKLTRDNIKCGMIHGAMEQRDRIRTIDEFRENRFNYLIATDVAARGIDFDDVTHVINYDYPTGRETYVHRIGRTARNGKSGTAISLVSDDDMNMKKMVDTYIGISLELQNEIPANTDVDVTNFKALQNKSGKRINKKSNNINKSITKLSISGGRKSKMRPGDIVGTVCSLEGIVMDDIGIIEVMDSITFVEILNGKGHKVYNALQNRTIKGKIRKVKIIPLR